MHKIIPQTVGSKNAKQAHFHPPASFLIVRSVVPQGKWRSVNIITFIPVKSVQPFELIYP